MIEVRRALAILLVALATSPLTAPFATCDLLDLLGVDTADVAALVTHKLTSASDAPVLVPAVARILERETGVAVLARIEATGGPTRRQISLPLRI